MITIIAIIPNITISFCPKIISITITIIIISLPFPLWQRLKLQPLLLLLPLHLLLLLPTSQLAQCRHYIHFNKYCNNICCHNYSNNSPCFRNMGGGGVGVGVRVRVRARVCLDVCFFFFLFQPTLEFFVLIIYEYPSIHLFIEGQIYPGIHYFTFLTSSSVPFPKKHFVLGSLMLWKLNYIFIYIKIQFRGYSRVYTTV